MEITGRSKVGFVLFCFPTRMTPGVSATLQGRAHTQETLKNSNWTPLLVALFF